MTKEQFAVKWEASKDKFYRMAYCYVKNENDALEILSEATYRAFCSLHKMNNPEYYETWMNKIIINASYDFLKRQKRYVALEENYEKENEDIYDEIEAKVDVYTLLEHVSTEEKTILILKYFDELSFKEIGNILGLPVNTVKTRTYRILSKLKKHLEKEKIYEGRKNII